MHHELTGEIPRVNLVVNSNLCLEQPALSVLFCILFIAWKLCIPVYGIC